MARVPALMAAVERRQVAAPQVVQAALDGGDAWWVSVPVLPCPGKCLAQAATPAPCRPATAAAACRATRPVSAPNDRVPTAGLSAEPSTSAHGARSKLMPRAARSAPIAWYTDLVSGRRPPRRARRCPGTGCRSSTRPG